ncbi:MAG TPA: phosphotransferase [Terriglobales bacterium]|nr:phosphotransferase [Terriglobales bacterium]
MIFAVVPPEQLAALAAWLPRQRWFGGKGAPIASIGAADAADLGGGGAILLVEVCSPGGGAPARYLLTPGGAAPEGLQQPAIRQRWFELLASQAVLPGGQGTFHFEPCAPLGAAASSRLLGAEQTNTSILYSDAAGAPRWLLKLFRRLQPGENPDFELPRALAAHSSFRHVPAALGRVVYRGAGGEATTLACLSEFIPNQGDGWEYALGRLRAGAGEALLADLALLGRRTAELHRALASLPAEPALAPEPIAAADLEAWRARARAGLAAEALRPYAALLAPWRRQLEAGPAGLAACLGLAKIRIHGDFHLGQVLRTADDFYLFDFEGEPARPLAVRRQKGCALQDVAGMLRSLGYAAATAQRPEWEAPARAAFLDAYRAGIVSAPVALVPARGGRAASPAGKIGAKGCEPGSPEPASGSGVVVIPQGGPPPGNEVGASMPPRAVTAGRLTSGTRAAGALGPAPTNDAGGFAAALRFFECEKAVYELGYELAHRPDWVPVPLAGLARLLG